MSIKENESSCCFTGHRPGKLPWGYNEESKDCILLKLKLAVQIEEMRRGGVTTFYSGMAQGVDIFAAEAVLMLKQAYPDEEIRLIAVIPYEGQANRWSAEYRERYYNILTAVDDNVCLHPRYKRGCMNERNRYMVKRCAHLIAVYGGEPGGTKSTVEYARKKGLDIVNIDPHDMMVSDELGSVLASLPRTFMLSNNFIAHGAVPYLRGPEQLYSERLGGQRDYDDYHL